MKKFRNILIAINAAIFILGFVFVIYKTTNIFAQYNQNISFMKASYSVLKKQYNLLQDKEKNLKKITIVANSKESSNNQIAEIINDYANKVDGDISIYYKNLTTEESVIIEGDHKYYMASLYKVILTLYVLDQIQNNKITLDTKVGTSSATIETALNKIITESNNEYAQTLAQTYGWANIQTEMEKKLGINFSFGEDLQTTVTNIGVLFEEIALSLKVKDNESNYLLNLLKDQTKLSKLPKYLPKNILSHNKTGEFEDYSHDAGIFYTPKANYVLMFMSKTKNPSETNEIMALMSKDIYETLNK